MRGYATGAERWQKQRRRQVLATRLARVEARIWQGRVSVVRGGRRLCRVRQHLEDAGLTEQQWRQRWDAERSFISADGEADKAWGNETIRVHPDAGWLELKLPAPLAHMANRPHGRYQLSCPARFSHRCDEWAAQATSGAVCYDISFDSKKRRWYLHASWTCPPVQLMTVQAAVADGVVAVDFNVGHLDCFVVDRPGMLDVDRRISVASNSRPGRFTGPARGGHDPPATRPGGSIKLRKTGSGDRDRVVPR